MMFDAAGVAAVQAFIGDHGVPLAVAAAAVATVGAHVPVRGRALRDRWRGAGPEPVTGARVLPASGTVLPATALVDLVADCPVPVDVASVHMTSSEATGEIAHRYRGHAEHLGVDEGRWCSVLVGGGDGAGPEARLALASFLVHRLGLLGFAARPLSDDEFAAASAERPTLLLARAAGRGHARRPHLWFTPATDVPVPDIPAQILGIGAGGGPVVTALSGLDHMTIRADHADPASELPALLLPALVTGARVGIRTHRPHHFAALLDYGAVLVPAAGEATLDVLVRDGPHHVAVPPPAMRAPATLTLADGPPPGSPDRATAPGAGTEMGPTLTMGPLTWTLHDGRIPGARPMRIRPLPNVAGGAGSPRSRTGGPAKTASPTGPAGYR